MNLLIKSITFSICILGMTSILSSQVTLLDVDFQDNTLGGLISVDGDGNVISDEFMGFDPGFGPAAVSGPTDIRAIGVSTFEMGATSDNWLISPALTINLSGSILSWEGASLSGDANQLETYRVMVSTSGQSVSDFTGELTRVNSENAQTTEHSVDLSAYVGQTIFIAFNQITTAGYALALDNIKVVEPSTGSSAELVSISGNRYQDIDALDLTIEVLNNGSEVINNITVEGAINGMAGEFMFNDLSIAPNEVAFLDFTDLFPFEVGEYMIRAGITMVNQNAVFQGPKDLEIFVVQNGPARKLVIEESTSTTCGACPLGFVEKQVMKLKYAEDVIVMSVHSEDPMSNFIYDLGLQSQDGYSGLPSAAMNRETFVEVDQMEQYFVDDFSTVAPVSIEMEQSLNPETRELNVMLTTTSHTNILDGQLQYAVAIVEDGVTGTDPMYAQANDYSFEALDIRLVDLEGVDWNTLLDPVPQQDMNYDDVARDIIGGFEGLPQSIPAISFQGNAQYQLSYNVSSLFDENRMRVIAMAIDSETGAIVNAVQQDVMVLSSIDSEPLSLTTKLFPNPASDFVNVELESDSRGPATMLLITMDGKQLLNQNIELLDGHNQFQLDISSINPGIYHLAILKDQKALVRRLVKS